MHCAGECSEKVSGAVGAMNSLATVNVNSRNVTTNYKIETTMKRILGLILTGFIFNSVVAQDYQGEFQKYFQKNYLKVFQVGLCWHHSFFLKSMVRLHF